ncbi:hypothetical protein ACVBEF_21270 [Glaciimonas sp. GG7]
MMMQKMEVIGNSELDIISGGSWVDDTLNGVNQQVAAIGLSVGSAVGIGLGGVTNGVGTVLGDVGGLVGSLVP